MGSLNLCHHPDRFIIRVTPYLTRRRPPCSTRMGFGVGGLGGYGHGDSQSVMRKSESEEGGPCLQIQEIFKPEKSE